jgi:hypothetical protein
MGSIIKLEGAELAAFALNLDEVRDMLNFDEKTGADIYAGSGLYSIGVYPEITYGFREPKDDTERERAKACLDYLRTWLNNGVHFRQLAEIGPHSIHLGWDETADGPISIAVENHIPGCEPNMDWSLNPDKGGIWFHG